MKISEVAAKAGVSPATVSRALNHPELVKQPTLDKILGVIKELDYIPHPAAQSLMTGKTYLVGLIVPNLLNSFIAQVVLGVEEELMAHGYTALICNSHEDFEREKYILRTLARRRVDGIIWVYPHNVHAVHVKCPLSLIGPEDSIVGSDVVIEASYDFTQIDEQTCMSIVANRLLDQGHTRIGVICGEIKYPITRARLAMFTEALAERGYHLDPAYIAVGAYNSIESGSVATHSLLQLEQWPTAIFAFNDMLAIGVLKVLADKKIKVPDEIAVIGIDDIPIAENLSPALTTVSSFSFNLGKKAAELLVSRIHNPDLPKRSVIMPVELVVRQSD